MCGRVTQFHLLADILFLVRWGNINRVCVTIIRPKFKLETQAVEGQNKRLAVFQLSSTIHRSVEKNHCLWEDAWGRSRIKITSERKTKSIEK